MSLSANKQVAMLPLRTRVGDDGDVQIRQRTSGQCGSYRLLATRGRSLRLGLAWDERSHRVPTLDRWRRMSCHDDSWAMRGFHNT